jgi:type I restriction enzyme, R subunit
MCTNFDFLKQNKQYNSFADQAIEAEKSLLVSSATSAILSRRALELAVRWVYSYDNALILPYQDNISSLIHEYSFRNILEQSLFPMIKYVIKLGNVAVHTNNTIKRDDAVLSLRNLYDFCKWIDYCYSDEYKDGVFDESLLEKSEELKKRPEELKDLYEQLSTKDRKLEEIRNEKEELREQLSAARLTNKEVRNFKVDKASEAQTRKKYIDISLQESGWVIGTDCLEEVEVKGMPNPTGLGYVDYVLYGSDGKPLAVVEAKKTSVDPLVGSQQAKLYADCLQNQYYRRPLILTTNGFEIFYTDDALGYPRRRVSGIFTKEELQLAVDRRIQIKPLVNLDINDAITNRPYQKEAVTAVCEAIASKHRKTLIVQATGSGKTRVAISIVDVLTRHNYVKNILFLADRKALVKQAKKNFVNLLPSLTCCNLLDSKESPEQSRMIFSTYPTMKNAIDEMKNAFGNKLFTPAHFDLIIIDESHRSIYRKFQDIFDYFDANLLGLTATPKNEIDKNTYSIFDLERGVPTFAYELNKAVEEGYLVDYTTIEVKTKIMEEGIHYDDLTEEEKDEFDETFEDDETITDTVSSAAVNEWLFNNDTIDGVLTLLMEQGLKVEGGDKLGKTIIFAKNSKHATAIVDRFEKRYPEYGTHFIKQIDYSIKYVDTLIDDFSTKEKMPQIAVSVDMLDTGIDIPEILNLVFFKKVRSYSKFWQMIGRGTRLCPDLLGVGLDKEKFLIFDFCNNFEFFRADTHGKETGIQLSVCEKIYNSKVMIARELQEPNYQSEEEYIGFRNVLIDELVHVIASFNMDSFRVKNHLRYVERYSEKPVWDNLETVKVSEIKEHISPLIIPTDSNELARRFDYLIYVLDLALLQGKDISTPAAGIIATAEELSKLYNVPQVKAEKFTIEKVMTQDFWNSVNILELDTVREALRDLIQYIEKDSQKIYYTDFTDEILNISEGNSLHHTNDLKNYRKKVEFYLKEHQDNIAIYKIRNNKKITEGDLRELENILWIELGTKTDYENEYGDTPIGKLIRKIVGVDREAVNVAFTNFLSEERLNSNQINFVRLIIDYIVTNGNIEDKKLFMQEPFRSIGSITALFKDDMGTAKQILNIVEEIKRNSEDIA